MKETQSDDVSFKESIGAVRPLKQMSKVKSPKKKCFSSSIKKEVRWEETKAPLPLSDYYTDTLTVDSVVDYTAIGESLSPEVIKKIKQGKYSKDRIIDLHGETVDSARDQLSAILQEAYEAEERCLLVIHGKGKNALLKNHVVHWLKQVSWVLFFCSANPEAGGTGALYVLLKRHKTETLLDVRHKIDALDKQIMTLLCERFKCAKKAGKLKKTLNPDAKREQEILMRARKKAIEQGVNGKNMEAIYLCLLEEMRKYQK